MNDSFVIKIKKIIPEAIIPTRGSDAAAGYDLYAASVNTSEMTGQGGFILRPHETIKVGTGIAMQIPLGFFGAIFARSGLASKQGLRPANCVGEFFKFDGRIRFFWLFDFLNILRKIRS